MTTHQAPPATGTAATPDERRALLRAELLRRAAARPAAPPTTHPVSEGQRALWLFEQMHPGSPAYHLCFAARVSGPLDAPALRTALQAVLDTHPVLRTAVLQEGERLVQRVTTGARVDFTEEDLTGRDDTEVDAAVTAFVERPYDLAQGSFLRCRLLRLGEDRHVLLLGTHHIAADLWAFSLILRDLQQAYPAARAGRPVALARPAADYREYVDWQRELVDGARGAASAAHWAERLAGEVPRLELPVDRPRPARPGHRTAVHAFTLDADVTAGLRRVARETGGTLYTAVLSVFNLLMHRYTGQDDIWLGSVSTGRGRAAFEDVVGYFANLMVLRTRIEREQTFRSLLDQVRETALDAMEHQDYPYPLVAEQAAQSGQGGGLFDVAFFYESTSSASEQGLSLFATGAAGARLAVGDLVMEPHPVPVQGSEHDLSVFAEEVDGRVSCSLRYATDLFDPETAEGLGRHFRALAAACAARPDSPHALLPMLSDDDREQVLTAWSRPGDPAALAHRGVHELVVAQAARTPDAPAVESGDERLTYRELVERAEALALVLRAHGVGPETKVGLTGDGTPRLFVGLLAILMAGGAYIPLDPTYPVKRLEYMIEDSSVSLLLAQRAVLGRLPAVDVPVLYLDDDHEPPVPAPALPEPDGGRLAYVIYTSGSTGRPKGVMVEHAGLVDFDLAHRESMPPRPGRRVLQNASISFDVSTWEWMMALTTGGTLVVAPREELRPGPPLVDTIRRERVTTLSATPSVLATMDPADLPTVTELTSVGEAVSAELVRTWSPGRRIVNAYGPTEITVFCTTEVCVPDGTLPPIGRALPGTELYVLDADLRPVPPGVVGELYLGGTGVTRGYQNRPDLTADRYVPHPFSDVPGARVYRTGDRVRFDRHGTLHYLGRADHQVKIRGVRIEPAEVQDALEAHPGVREAVVMARPGRDGRLILAGYVLKEATAQEPPTVGALRSHLAERLTSAMIPSHLFVMDAFPLNPNGKVDRALLPAPEDLPDDGTSAALPPTTPSEKAVAEVWSELLGAERIAADANFFELGGHSLLAIQAASRLHEATGVELPLRDLFDAPVLRDVAARIDVLADAGRAVTDPAARTEPIPRLERGPEGLPLSSAQQRMWFVEQLRPGGLAYRIAGELHLEGPVDTDALRAALTEVVARHEALRTVYVAVSGEPRQVVTEGLPDGILPEADLSGLAADARETARKEHTASFNQRPFDLTRSPLHTQLIKLAEDRYVVQLSVHHIAADGWSMRLVVRELSALYTAFVQGERDGSAVLTDAVVQYADFAGMQTHHQNGAAGEAELAHWTEVLAGAPAALDLPTDRPRRDRQDRPAARERRTIAAGLTERLRGLAGEENASLSMALLTVYNALLSRWSGQDDIVVGMPVAGRSRKDLEHSVGLYVNTVAVRTDTSGAPAFRELLRRVRTNALDADAHQGVPFERIVDRLAPDRDLTRTPVFQVLFNMLNLDDSHPPIPGVRTRLVGTEDLSARFDLTLYVQPAADGSLGLDLVHDASLFEARTVTAFLDQFEALLAAVVAEPERPLGELVPPRAATLPDPGRPLPPAPWTAAVHERFAATAAARPGTVALRHRGTELTYGELAGAVDSLAAELRAAGTGRGDVVAVHAERSPALVVAVLAALRSGAAFSVLDRTHPVERREQCARLLGAKAWLETRAGEPEVLGPPPVLAATATTAATAAGAPHPAPERVPALPADTAYIAFTSGTTGAPKGVVASHAPLAHFVDWYTRTFDVSAADRFALTSGLGHDPLLRDLFVPLSIGARLHVPDEEDRATPEAFAAWLAAEEITVLHLTPPMARFLAGLPDGSLPSLRLAFFGGDVLTGREAATLRRLAPGVRLVNFYGATETPQAPAWHPVGEAAPDESVPLGTGIDGSQLLVMRDRFPAAIGELGEIVVRTPYLADGYLGGDASARFTADPAGRHGERLYFTGDLGRHREDGTVVFAGRADRQVKVRGHRVDLTGVEHCLRGHPAVTAAVVAPVTDTTGELSLAAWVTTQAAEDAPADADALRTHLLTRLPAAMVPGVLEVVDAFPLTANGKVDVARLRARRRAAERAGTTRTPVTRTEERVRGLWRELLDVEDLGRDDTFFGRGGHSLQLVPLQTRLREEFSLDVPVVDLLRHPTVAALARHLDRLAGGGAEEGGTAAHTNNQAARDEAAQRARRAADRRRRMRRGQGDV